MHVAFERRQEWIELKAQELIRQAELMSMVVTIETKPLEPLAMGHHQMVYSVRPARELAK